MKLICAFFAALLFYLPGCDELVNPPRPQTPCRADVGPIRNNALIIVINYNFAYTARDPGEARAGAKVDILDELNDLGMADGNTFAESNGQPVNFYFNYTIYNDGQDHYTGSVEVDGWGWGRITTIYSGQYPYASPFALVRDLTGKAYSWINTGWHDSRPSCG
jgi:hypothetical protein